MFTYMEEQVTSSQESIIDFNKLFNGRLSRMQFFVGYMVLGCIDLLLYILFLIVIISPLSLLKTQGNNNSNFTILFIMFLIEFIFFICLGVSWFWSISMQIRRLHDLGKSGWNVLIGFIPIIGWIYAIYLFIITFFIKGNPTDNRYGAVSSLEINLKNIFGIN